MFFLFVIFSLKVSHIKQEVDGSTEHVGSASESLEAQKIELWEQLAVLITPCIQRVVEFAKRIPGFCDLTQDDQLILIKLGFFELWIVHIAKTADFVEQTITFSDGSFLNRQQLELMFDVSLLKRKSKHFFNLFLSLPSRNFAEIFSTLCQVSMQSA